MTIEDRFSSKAETYAKYRWDYAPEAVRYVLDAVKLCQDSVVVDVGSGTGILTKHFLDEAGRVFAIEPIAEMRRMAEEALAKHPAFRSVGAPSHATTLPDGSVDLIVAGQATHFFDAEPTRAEFLRILKPGGWLAIFSYVGVGTNEDRRAAARMLRTEENGCETFERDLRPAAFWFGHDDFTERRFAYTRRQNWEQYLGGVSSASWAPGGDHPLYTRFKRAARDLFDRFASDGWLVTNMETKVDIGHPR